MKKKLIHIDELRPIVEAINSNEITYGKAIKLITETVEANLNNGVLDDVINQRELLLDFLNEMGRYDYEKKPFIQIVDEYLCKIK